MAYLLYHNFYKEIVQALQTVPQDMGYSHTALKQALTVPCFQHQINPNP